SAAAKAIRTALLGLVAPAVAAAQDRGGLPVVTPSPLNTTPPGAPHVVDAPPPPPAPGPAVPVVVPVPTLAPPRAAPRVADFRTDSTGFVPDHHPGPPPVPAPP